MKISRSQAGWHVLLIAVVLVSLVPILFAIDTSLQYMKDIYGTAGIIPVRLTLSNYTEIFSRIPLARIILNTLLIATVVTLFKVSTSTLAAYAFAYFSFPGKNLLYVILISTIFVPFTVTMIPNFLTLSRFQLLDSVWGVMLPQLADATGIFLIRQSMRTIPKSYMEISTLSNIGHMRILKDIVLPISRPAVISTAIIFFINSWNEYVWPMLVLSSEENYTLSLALQMFVDAEAGYDITITMAMSVITMALPILLYLVFQRHIMNTFAASGIKG